MPDVPLWLVLAALAGLWLLHRHMLKVERRLADRRSELRWRLVKVVVREVVREVQELNPGWAPGPATRHLCEEAERDLGA